MKIRNAAAAATGFALLGTALAGTAQATPTTEDLTLSVTQSTARSTADAAAAACRPGLSRTRSCQVVNASVTVRRNGTPVGQARFTISHQMTLQVKSHKWEETISVSKAQIISNAGGIRMGLKVTCGNPCSTSNKFPQGRTLGAPVSGKIGYTDNTKAFKSHGTASRYSYTFLKAGYTPGGFAYSSASYRCDDTYAKKPGQQRARQRPGCVFPQVTPTLTDMASLPNIGPGIKKIQARGGHYGRPGSGHPLHYLTDKAKSDANRRAVCAGKTAPPGSAGPSCDEYPFASTREGGTALPAASRGITWVPVRENNRQGGMINKFELGNRLLNGDAFWVKV
ncbi:NucA/NucB deoxyribonuclease domain-containing protein [Streptomyces syringium]|uniref:NucA/NucB deoxyribonuclease domain-containing protein n=1 Tax=Streptomyces syringium TaxID=76729 RepID=UPI003454C47D